MAGRRLCSRSSKWWEIRIWSTSWQGVSGVELQEQAFAQVAGADAGRVELLDQLQRLLGLLAAWPGR